ncbi:helix-turn-helix domain-containing protein [Kordiimonas pumila]|uniref:Helix-turn-helix domain-containing protein n=1 Tax=Kordiimonas pumila TaxID=2161677 RepID=A0ABV7D657_9PROT|nr:XRE family transcriptional regulator [Kordiimonas pumila]
MIQESTKKPEEKTLGSLLGAVRRSNGWTLKQMSQVIGIPLSTLGKVESDKLSLTFDKLQQVTARLGMSIAEFVAGPSDKPETVTIPVTARRSLVNGANQLRVETANYDYKYLCADLRKKRMVPILVTVRTKSLEEFGPLAEHDGEEFLYVLSGSIEVHLAFYTPIRLDAGQGIYIDSGMGHAYIALDCDEAEILCICSSDDHEFQSKLVTLAEAEQKRLSAVAES